eukprot:scaffold869_cov160-Ochromonas_danica.AAC.14
MVIGRHRVHARRSLEQFSIEARDLLLEECAHSVHLLLRHLAVETVGVSAESVQDLSVLRDLHCARKGSVLREAVEVVSLAQVPDVDGQAAPVDCRVSRAEPEEHSALDVQRERKD